MKRKSLLFVLPVLGMALAGCTINPDYKKPGEEEHEKEDEDEVKFEVEEEVSIGVTQTHKIAVEASGGTGVVTYVVTDGEGIIEVDASGTITGIAEGEAVVTVTYNGQEKYCSVTVLSEEDIVHVEKIMVDTLNLSLKKGETHQIVTEFQPENVTNQSLSYLSENTAVCSVSIKGLVTAVGAGSTTITVTPEDDPSKAKTIKVLVTEDTDIEHDGTADNPYTAAEAATIALKLEQTEKSDEIKAKTEPVYVKGTVTEVSTPDADVTKYGNYSFMLDGVFQVWRIKNGEDKANFAIGDIAVGFEVTICGELMNFKGTPENTSNAYVVSIVKEGVATPTSIKEVKTIPASITQGETLKAASIVIILNMSDGTTKEVSPTSVVCDTSEVKDNVQVTLGYTGLDPFTTTINVVAGDPVVAGDFYRVKSQAEITAGTYILVFETQDGKTKVFNGLDAANGFISKDTVGHIAADSSMPKVVLEEMEGGFALKVSDAGGTNDGKYMYDTTSANKILFSTEQKLNSISHTDDGDDIVCDTMHMRYNNNNGDTDQRFRYYKEASYTNQQPVHLYKMAGDTPTPPPATPTLSSIALSGTHKTTFDVGDTFSYEGLIVTASYSSGSPKTVTPTSVSTPDMTTAGTKTITVSYTEGTVTKTATYTITVSDAGGGGGTEQDSYTATVVAKNYSFENAQAVSEIDVSSNVKISFAAGSNTSNSPKYYNTGEAVRVYSGNTITISNTAGNIKSVELTLASGGGENTISADVGSVEGYSWTGSAGTVVITVDGSSGHLRVSQLVINYEGGSAPTPITKSIESVTLSATSKELTVDDTFTLTATVIAKGGADKTVTWESSDTSKVTVENGVVTAVAATTSAVTITCKSTFDETKTAACSITVKAKQEGGDTLITLSKEGGVNADLVKVIVGEDEFSGLKAGTSKATGSFIIKVPSTAKKLKFCVALWKGSDSTDVEISGLGEEKTISAVANDGIAGNSPYTFSGDAASYAQEIDLGTLASETSLTFSSSVRFVVWNVRYSA